MERAVLLADEGIIHSYHLPINLQPIIEHLTEQEGLEARLAQVEYDLIVDAMTTFQGNVSRAAAHLNITRRALGLRLDKYQLNYKSYRGRV